MSDYKVTKHPSNDENPFINKAIKEVQNSIVKKYKTASKTDQKAILQAIDPNTGQALGHTSFIRQIEVDEQQFAKLYLTQFEHFFNLKKQGIKVFGYIMNNLVPDKDLFIFLPKECMKYTGYKSVNSVLIGLGALLDAEIIARGPSDVLYFINPLIFFNGNRITYIKTYVKRKKANPNEIEIFDKNGEAKEEWQRDQDYTQFKK